MAEESNQGPCTTERICIEIDKKLRLQVSRELADRLHQSGMLQRMGSDEKEDIHSNRINSEETMDRKRKFSIGIKSSSLREWNKGSFKFDLNKHRERKISYTNASPCARRKIQMWGEGGSKKGDSTPNLINACDPDDSSSSDEEYMSAPSSPMISRRQSIKDLFTRTDSLRRKIFKKRSTTSTPNLSRLLQGLYALISGLKKCCRYETISKTSIDLIQQAKQPATLIMTSHPSYLLFF